MANVQLRSFGGLNTDSHIQDIRNGDYTDAKNIDHVSTADGESLAITPRVGNEFGFSLGEITRQNKVYIFIPPTEFPEGGFVISFFRTDQVTELIPDLIIEGDNVNSIRSQVTQHFQTFNISVYLQDGGEFNPALSSYAGSFVVVPGQGSEIGFCYDYIIESTGTNILDIQIVQEAISPSRSGLLEVVGSKSIGNDLFIISTSKRDKPFNINALDVLSIGGDVYIVPETQDFEHISGIEIYITGVPSVPQVNGMFIAIFELQPSGLYWIRLFNTYIDPATLVYQGGGIIEFNPLGIGEIGVAQKDESKNTWEYTRLLRSKELNLFTYHQCETQGEVSSNLRSIYFTDNFNPPRCFYYKSKAPYIKDGAVKVINPLYGIYNYESINTQTRHILGQGLMDISYETQIQNGGSLYAGNHRYFVRGVLSDGSYTDWSLPSNPIPVYNSSTTDNPYKIVGNIEGSQTGKQNVIRISNINSAVYDYIEVAAIVYVNITFDATQYGIFAKLKIAAGQIEIVVNHNGGENVVELNPDELSVQTQTYATAKNNELLDNRYILSNLKDGDTYDIDDLFETATYSLKYKTIQGPGVYPDITFGGFQDPSNVFNFTGYMLNETYRIGARVIYKNGAVSLIRKLFDVTIDAEQDSTDGRRTSGLSDYGLYGFNGEYRVPYIEVSGIDISNKLLSGVLASEIIERVEFFRAEVSNPTIIGSGYAVLHVNCIYEGSQPIPGIPTPPEDDGGMVVFSPKWLKVALPSSIVYNFTIELNQLPAPIAQMPYNDFGRGIIDYEFPFISGFYPSSPTPTPLLVPQSLYIPDDIRYYDPRYTQGLPPNNSSTGYIWNDTVSSIYLIDDIVNGTQTKISAGDVLVNIGQPDRFAEQVDTSMIPNNYYRSLVTTSFFLNKEEIGITRSELLTPEAPIYFENNWVYKKFGKTQSYTSGVLKSYFKAYSNNPSYVVKTSQPPSNMMGYIDNGVRYIQIKRNIENQYSQSNEDQYIYLGAHQSIKTSNVIDLFGGDAFTTHTYLRHFIANENKLPDQEWARGDSQGLTFLAQTRTNPHLLYKQENVRLWPWDAQNLTTNALKMKNYFESTNLDEYFYNSGYNIRMELAYRAGFSIGETYATDYPTRIIYSDSKPQTAKTDFYRRFGVFSYADLDSSFGEINSMKNINGELFTLQVSKFQKQFFNTRGTLSVSDGTQVVLGDAGVLSRPGITITSYGCSNKWSSFLGRSAGGDDVLYWYDEVNKKLMRFGADGAIPISDRSSVRTMVLNGLKWILDFDSPADNYGIHGIWNQRLNEATWTCRAYRKEDIIWSESQSIPAGSIVILKDEQNFLNFEKTAVLYVCTNTHVATQSKKPGVGSLWTQYYTRPSIDDPEYYSIKTITWNESKNKFINRDETPHPRIYLRWKDTYLSPRPADEPNAIYEHNEGEYLQWYMLGGQSQTEPGFIDVIFNIDPNTTKQFISLICNSEIVPSRIEAFTKNHSTVMTAGEFLEQLDQYVAPIPNNIQNGSTGEDNTFLYGQWIKVRFYFDPLQFQRLTNIVLKFNPMARLWNS
jgi:hypothetical protein